MITLAPSLKVLLLVLAAAAAAIDLRTRKIPNWLTVSGAVAGLAGNVMVGSWPGLRTAALGLGVALVVYLLLYTLRGVGGGDVKLMAAAGSITGASHWILLFVLTSIAGGVCAVVLMIAKGRVRSTLRNVGRILGSLLRFQAPFKENPDLDVANPEALRMPHALSIALGTLAFLAIA